MTFVPAPVHHFISFLEPVEHLVNSGFHIGPQVTVFPACASSYLLVLYVFFNFFPGKIAPGTPCGRDHMFLPVPGTFDCTGLPTCLVCGMKFPLAIKPHFISSFPSLCFCKMSLG